MFTLNIGPTTDLNILLLKPEISVTSMWYEHCLNHIICIYLWKYFNLCRGTASITLRSYEGAFRSRIHFKEVLHSAAEFIRWHDITVKLINVNRFVIPNGETSNGERKFLESFLVVKTVVTGRRLFWMLIKIRTKLSRRFWRSRYSND